MSAALQWLPGFTPMWFRVDKFDARAARLADRHYSRQTVGASQIMPPGETLVLLGGDGLAVWGVCHNLDPAGGARWRCTIFRNEGQTLSSDLIRIATDLTYERWRTRYAWPSVPLTTEINAELTARRRSRRQPPGWCFLCAGWTHVDGYERRGMVMLRAPDPGDL